MDRLIVILVIAAASAISNWLKKRKQADGAGDSNNQGAPGTTPPTRRSESRPSLLAPPPRQAPTASWQEELRRMLEGESPVAPPRPRPAPPIATAPPRPMAPPPVAPVIVPRPLRPVVARESSPGPTPIPVPTVTSVTSQKLAPMAESRQAYDKASRLDRDAAAKIEKVATEPVGLTLVIREKVSPEVAQAVSLFRSPRTVRHAVIASVILGPPRGLEPAAYI